MVQNSVLVIMPGGLGDAICTFAALNKLKNSYNMTLVSDSNHVGLFSDIHGVQKCFPYEARLDDTVEYMWGIDLFSMPDKYDPSILLKCRNKIYRQWNDISVIVVEEDNNIISKPYNLLKEKLLWRDPYIPAWMLEAPLVAHVLKEEVEDWLDEGVSPVLCFQTVKQNTMKHGIVVVPCGSVITKRYPEDDWITLINQLSGIYNDEITVVLGPQEISVYKKLLEITFINYFKNNTLLELAQLFINSSLVIANDCGPMHLAAAIGVPTIGIFGPTDPRCWFCYPKSIGTYLWTKKSREYNKNNIAILNKPWHSWPKTKEILSIVKTLKI